MNEKEIVKFVEPIFRFCVKRLNNRHDAEDLASEIMVHILSGIEKYHIDSLEKWVWRIAYNRYARFIDIRNKRMEIPSESDFTDIPDDYDFVDEMLIAEEYQQVFNYLHTLSSEYRNILVDFYIGQLPIKQIANRYALTETTVKWRLNTSRKKIKTRIEEHKMDKVYKRINWNTTACNGSMNSNKYLHSQIARAICEAAYDKPLTVEEISIKTGLPTLYIEDEIPRLISGDAIVKEGNKFATNFIVLRLCDKQVMEKKFAPIIADIADYFTELFREHQPAVSKMNFYGSDFTMKRLGYIALPAILRGKVRKVKDSLNMKNGPFPPRLDGGYGWFIIEETKDELEQLEDYGSGCNASGDETKGNYLYYLWIGKYFNENIYLDDGIPWLVPKDIDDKGQNVAIPSDSLSEDEIIRLIKANLVIKDGDSYKFNFAIFTKEQFDDFKGCFNNENTNLDETLAQLITDIHKSFKAFVPKRLDSQINQWVSCYVHNIIGFIAEELIARDVLEKPDDEKPLTNGVFCVLGKYFYI